jgi:hypothetical protein
MFVGRGQIGVAGEGQGPGTSDYQSLLGSASAAASEQQAGSTVNAEPSDLNNLRINSQDEIDMAIQGEFSASLACIS